ncbi:Histidine utilization repressor [Rhodovulum sp. PH10]|uniref:GntR family transcriptional regulator n=1 Tax=Rhodovulum sp. PH10 TaxID=1187851 RepID=UPI00027C298A|nr:GntR family transcriptional regulator [Rhodovulum sp. PH10]EJW10129.1 Histidine utilization repressor [Rhodovulum sp. PH10]
MANELRTRITSGVYAPGSRLPSLSELMEEFSVSAITVRRALTELTYEGLIRGHQGLGVFVKDKPRIHRVLAGSPEHTIGDEITRAGFEPRLMEIGYAEVEADETIAARLKVPRGSRIFAHTKLTFADDEPVALHVLHLRPRLAKQLRNDLATQFIFVLLKTRKVPIDILHCTFCATTLGEEHADLFGLPAGAPVLRVEYTMATRTGTPMMLGTTIARAERFTYEVELQQRRPRR